MYGKLPFNINERFTELMIAKGLNPYQITKNTLLSRSTLSNFLKKKKGLPSIETLYDSLQAMNVSMSEFFMETDRNTLCPQEEEVLDWFNGLDEESKLHFLNFLRSRERALHPEDKS